MSGAADPRARAEPGELPAGAGPYLGRSALRLWKRSAAAEPGAAGAAPGLLLISPATRQTQHCPRPAAIINRAPRPAGAAARAARAPAPPGTADNVPRSSGERSLQPRERAGCRRPRNASCSWGCLCSGARSCGISTRPAHSAQKAAREKRWGLEKLPEQRWVLGRGCGCGRREESSSPPPCRAAQINVKLALGDPVLMPAGGTRSRLNPEPRIDPRILHHPQPILGLQPPTQRVPAPAPAGNPAPELGALQPERSLC